MLLSEVIGEVICNPDLSLDAAILECLLDPLEFLEALLSLEIASAMPKMVPGSSPKDYCSNSLLWYVYAQFSLYGCV